MKGELNVKSTGKDSMKLEIKLTEMTYGDLAIILDELDSYEAQLKTELTALTAEKAAKEDPNNAAKKEAAKAARCAVKPIYWSATKIKNLIYNLQRKTGEKTAPATTPATASGSASATVSGSVSATASGSASGTASGNASGIASGSASVTGAGNVYRTAPASVQGNA